MTTNNSRKLERSEAFRNLLQKYFNEKMKSKSRYSLRAFAFDLEIDAANLHRILKGERNLGPRSIVKLGKKIGLSSEQIKELLALGSDSGK